ncbi:sirohydrochlorin chelatase [Actinopolymorpha pittospori]
MSIGVLVVAHGSRDPRAAPVARRVAADVATQLPGVATAAAFLELSAPSPTEALDQLADSGVEDVAVVPYLLSDAYHSRVDLPAVADLARARGWTARLGQVLGPDPRLLDALGARLEEALGGAEVDAVVLAAAGSSDVSANRTVGRVATDLGARLGLPALCAFASAATPTVATAVEQFRSCGSARVAVATYLLAPGFFADQIRDAALAAGAVAVSEPLGACPEVAHIVVDRARLACPDQI